MVSISEVAGASSRSGLNSQGNGSVHSAAAQLVAARIGVTGLVQGVGFRPFVHRLAMRFGVMGWVRNRAGDVEIHAECEPAALAAFLLALKSEPPPLSRIEAATAVDVALLGYTTFSIRHSADDARQRQPVSPDSALCAACEAELFDPANRRFHHAFITCTDCGPRFTVIEAMPYDRERTSMAAFTQCAECRREYESPGERRYHSESNCCPVCGPVLWHAACEEDARSRRTGDEAIAESARRLLAGEILAIRGLGGFHLAVDATNEVAVRRLRERKQREAKPFAVMVRSLTQARDLAIVWPAEAQLLRSAERPVVLLERRLLNPLAESVCGDLNTVGVMLAYTPLQHLLLEQVARPLIMTSGNVSEEPIAIGNEEALARLNGIADSFLLHDRDIVSRYDDSVLRVVKGAPTFLRRARGYAPLPIDMPVRSPHSIVAVGPHLKNTFAIAQDRTAYVSQHVGDLENLETLEHFRATLRRYCSLFRVQPQVAVRDLHPGYLSTRIAGELGLETFVVQHHHAHIAAVAAEHGITHDVIGVAFDGTGYGPDGHTWGAEFLLASTAGYRRLAHLRYAPLPGGDLAARRPWRAALGYLSLENSAAVPFARAFESVAPEELRMARVQIERGLNSPLASSMGRLFDAAAAVIGIRRVSCYEAQAAMELETLAGRRSAHALPFPILEESQDGRLLDPVPLLVALGEQRARGVDAADLAAAFHESVATATAQLTQTLCDGMGLETVALGGGVFQNARLLSSLRSRLEARGLRVLTAARLPANDGGISYGQAVVAATLLAHGVRASNF